MAATLYGVNDPVAVKIWRRKLARDTIAATFIGKFVGETADSLIQVYGETNKDAGDEVTVTLRGKLVGDGVLGDGTQEGNEEALSTFTDKLAINQLRHASRNGGRMSSQRVPWKFREEAKDALRDWWAERLDVAMMNQLAGNTAETDIRYTGNQNVTAPTSIIRPNARANDESLVAGDEFKKAHIDAAVVAAKTRVRQGRPAPMRPLKIDGQELWVMFIHPLQAQSLKDEVGAQSWTAIQMAAIQGGEGRKNNPLFSGALGIYNNVVLHESVWVPHGVNSATGAVEIDTRRAVLCGAQAGAIAFGQDYGLNNFDWAEEKFDYGNQFGVACGLIFGLKKTRYNSQDFAATVVSTYSSATDV